MKYLKVIGLALFFFISMVFFIQNTPVLSEEVQLSLELFDYKWTSIPIPYYVLILGLFFIGALLATLYFLAEKFRLSGMLKRCHSRVQSLEKELNSLRNMPLEDQGYGKSENENESMGG
jgi:putative membrane protein